MAQSTLDRRLRQRSGVRRKSLKGRSAGSTQRAADDIRKAYPQLEAVTVVESEKEAVENVQVLMTGANASPNDSRDFPQVRVSGWLGRTLAIAPGATRFDVEFLNNTRKVIDYLGLYEEWRHEYNAQVAYDSIAIIGSRMLKLQHDGHFSREALQQIGDVAAGRAGARKSDDEIIIYSVGGSQ